MCAFVCRLASLQGTFGQVVSCWCDEMQRTVAVKVIKNQPAYFHQVGCTDCTDMGHTMHTQRQSEDPSLQLPVRSAYWPVLICQALSGLAGSALFSRQYAQMHGCVCVCARRMQARVEIGLLHLLNTRCDPDDQRHIVRMVDSFIFRKHLCIVFEKLDVNLFELLKRNAFKGLSLPTVQVRRLGGMPCWPCQLSRQATCNAHKATMLPSCCRSGLGALFV